MGMSSLVSFEDTKEIRVKCDKSPIQNHWAVPIISIHLY
jgi:hypothetical protein